MIFNPRASKIVKRLALAFVILFFGTGATVSWLAWHAPTIQNDSDLVKNGMTLADVQLTWGAPVELRQHTEECQEGYWFARDGMLILCFIDGKVTEKLAIPHEGFEWFCQCIRYRIGI